MELIPSDSGKEKKKEAVFLAAAMGVAFCLYFFANPVPQTHYDYTTRIAVSLLEGRLGLEVRPPAWLNEFVPHGPMWFSVFPLGSVLTMLPFAVLQLIAGWETIPANWPSSLAAAGIAFFLVRISARYGLSLPHRALYCTAFLAGSWMLPNLAFAGAWQLAIGWATLGILGAIYFTNFSPRPFLAGFFFALAFGNRTELLLLTPIFFWLLVRDQIPKLRETFAPSQQAGITGKILQAMRSEAIARIILFCVVPGLLGVLTLWYNFMRFGSALDFGYARIPGVLDEPWYHEGIFSISYLGLNAREMLWRFLRPVDFFPWFVPTGFGGAIWLYSPWIFLILRPRSTDRALSICCWVAIVVITFVLWIHGNPGGWQVSYRYAIPLLPWAFLLLLESSRGEARPVEVLLIAASTGLCAAATYAFLWTDWMRF